MLCKLQNKMVRFKKRMDKRSLAKEKYYKKIIGITIFFMIIFPYLCPLIVNADTTQYKKYLALGDSIAYGYGLKNRDTESYAAIVKNKYNISNSNFDNLAISGMTCAEFCDKIKTEEYTEKIKKADLITVSIGSNEILTLITEPLADFAQTDKSDPAFMEKVQERFKTATLQEKINVLTIIYNFFTSESTKTQIDQAIETYKVKWKESVDYIREINPNVTLVATEFYNPYYEVNLLNYDFGGFCDDSIKKLNKILQEQSQSGSRYKIAEIYNAFNSTNPRLTNVDISITNLNLDPHPSKTGHEMIATKIIDKLIPADEQKKKDIILLTISSVPDQVYTGNPIEPKVVIKDGEETLVEGQDYTISYENNVNVGQAKIILVGIGYYTGRVSKTFNIINSSNEDSGDRPVYNPNSSDDPSNSDPSNPDNPDDPQRDPQDDPSRRDINELRISNIDPQTYTGFEITPDVEIKDKEKQLKKDTDYTLIYKNNIDVGTADVIITGIGNYTNSKSVNFMILSKEISKVEVNEIEDQKYTGKEIKPNIIVYDGSSKLKENKDYELQFSNNKNIGTATVKIEGKGNYKGSTTKTFKIVEDNSNQKRSVEGLEISDVEDKVYTGKSITPEVRIKDGDTVLTKNRDYLITYSNNIDKGKAIITITGKGNYTGQVEKEFNILAKKISDVERRDIRDQTYSGKEIKPDIIIQNNYTKLDEEKDYDYKIENNINVGTAKITINGKGNFEGTTYKTFNIVAKNINFIRIQSIPSQEYTGREITPEITINSGDVNLENGKDYTIKYENNINKGTAKVIVEGIGNYTGTVSQTFRIVEASNNSNNNSNNNNNNNNNNNSNNNTNSSNQENSKFKINNTNNMNYNNNNNNSNNNSINISDNISNSNNDNTNSTSNNSNENKNSNNYVNNNIANKTLPKAGSTSPKYIIISAIIKIALLGIGGKVIKISGI